MSNGLDVRALVDKLMLAEKVKLLRLDAKKQKLSVQYNHIQQMKEFIKGFSTTVDKQFQLMKQSSFQAKSLDEKTVSASVTGNNLIEGEHTVEILQKAQAHQLGSQVYGSKSDPLFLTSNIKIMVGTQEINIAVNPEDSLETIKNNINNATNNKNVSASILATTDSGGNPQYRLIVASNQTGIANAMTIDSAVLDLSQELVSAQDAKLKFDGFTVTRSTNTISDILEGLTINLNAATGSAVIRIERDSDKQYEMIKMGLDEFITGYNNLIENINKNQSVNLTKETGYYLIKSELQKVIESQFNAGKLKTILDLGIKSAKPETMFNEKGTEYKSIGKLTIDYDQLKATLQKAPQDIEKILMGDNGLFSTIQSTIKNITQTNNILESRENSIKGNEAELNILMDSEKSRLVEVEKRYLKQYAALDALISKYQNLSAMLENQFFNNNKR